MEGCQRLATAPPTLSGGVGGSDTIWSTVAACPVGSTFPRVPRCESASAAHAGRERGKRKPKCRREVNTVDTAPAEQPRGPGGRGRGRGYGGGGHGGHGQAGGRGGGNPEGSFWCALHGSNPSHATDECHTLSAKREERLAWGDGGHLSARPVEYHTHAHAPEPWGQPVHPRAVEQIL